jgi:hypothetical protein
MSVARARSLDEEVRAILRDDRDDRDDVTGADPSAAQPPARCSNSPRNSAYVYRAPLSWASAGTSGCTVARDSSTWIQLCIASLLRRG